MEIINSLFSWFIRKRLNELGQAINNPIETQSDLLKNLISTASDTEWGKKYQYQSVKTSREFKARVPLQDYESHKPYIERLMNGENNLLWPSKIKWFSKSSGTTQDKSKFIPVSAEALEECHYKGGKDLYALYYNAYPESQIFTGKALVMGGSHKLREVSNELSYGDISAILIQNVPWWANLHRTPDLRIALMDEWENKIEQMARQAIQEDVSQMVGVPTWTVVLIKKIFEITGKNDMSEVWPSLELYVHGGVSFSPYRHLFQELIRSSKMNYWETYNASEGFFGIQDQRDSDELLLLLNNGIYYEFLPETEIGKDDPQTLSLEDVKTETNYALIISTNAGLWRYNIGDTIRFTSLDPFRIKITGRTKSFINAFGEELMVGDAEKALAETCHELRCSVTDFTAGPVYFSVEGKGAHEWFLEFETEPDDFERFIDLLDEKLTSTNSDYEAKRINDLALQRPVMHKLEPGTFYRWMKQQGKLGGQNKVPRLANDRKIIEQLNEFLKSPA
ncbi:MAG: GH3 auxin-responsive promoter family protein [Bacteroidia bacterium]